MKRVIWHQGCPNSKLMWLMLTKDAVSWDLSGWIWRMLWAFLPDSLLWAEIHMGKVTQPAPRRYRLHPALPPSGLLHPWALLWALFVCLSCFPLPCGVLEPLPQRSWPASDKYHLITEQVFLPFFSAQLLLLKTKLHSNTAELPF